MSPLEPFQIRALNLQSYIDLEIKIASIDKFNKMHRGNAKASAPSYKNFKDIPSKLGFF